MSYPVDHAENDAENISKSEIKREMHVLKDMGARLMEMKSSVLDKLSLSDRLRDALEESKRITSHNARKRHMGFIGKLMQNQDVEQIEIFLARLDNSSEEHKRHFHQLERWRDRLINGGKDALTDYIAHHPAADQQHICQLTRNAIKEADKKKPPAAARKLFKYLREIDES